MNADELDPDAVSHDESHKDPLVMDNATLSWDKAGQPTLRNIDLKASHLILHYRAEKKSWQILLSSIQAGPGRKVKQEQGEISRNHVPRLFLSSVLLQSREKVLVCGCEKFLPTFA